MRSYENKMLLSPQESPTPLNIDLSCSRAASRFCSSPMIFEKMSSREECDGACSRGRCEHNVRSGGCSCGSGG